MIILRLFIIVWESQSCTVIIIIAITTSKRTWPLRYARPRRTLLDSVFRTRWERRPVKTPLLPRWSAASLSATEVSTCTSGVTQYIVVIILRIQIFIVSRNFAGANRCWISNAYGKNSRDLNYAPIRPRELLDSALTLRDRPTSRWPYPACLGIAATPVGRALPGRRRRTWTWSDTIGSCRCLPGILKSVETTVQKRRSRINRLISKQKNPTKMCLLIFFFLSPQKMFRQQPEINRL